MCERQRWTARETERERDRAERETVCVRERDGQRKSEIERLGFILEEPTLSSKGLKLVEDLYF